MTRPATCPPLAAPGLGPLAPAARAQVDAPGGPRRLRVEPPRPPCAAPSPPTEKLPRR